MDPSIDCRKDREVFAAIVFLIYTLGMSFEEKIKILVVEDSDVIRKNIGSSLRTLGYVNITGLSNGKAALEFLETNKVDLIVSDWYMEPVDGISLIKNLRESPIHKNVTFVMLSGETAKEKVMSALKSGIDGYIVKPFTLNMLGIKIHEALKKRGKVK